MNNKQEIEQLRNELETERMRLAACSTAALGYFNGCKDEYKSASLDDVLLLKQKYDLLRRDAIVSLQSHENEIIEKCAAMFDGTELDRLSGGTLTTSIRALKTGEEDEY